MKNKIFVLCGLAAFAMVSQAQTTCQSVATQRPCGDLNSIGTATQKIGNPSSTTTTAPAEPAQVGRQHLVPFGDRASMSSSQQVGNQRVTTYGNGVTSSTQQVGNQSFTTYSNGRSVNCQMVGNQRVCS